MDVRMIHYACRRGWPRAWGRVPAGMAAVVLAVAASGLTMAGTLGMAGSASAITLPMVSGGGGGSCAVLPDQSTWCWGSNATGQLGDGSLADSMVPVKVSGLPAVAAVSDGQSNDANSSFNHACAVDTTGQVWCWGSNSFGELGNGTTSAYSKSPVLVQGGLLATQVSAGDGFTCAVTAVHTVKCWGDNNYGELGNGTNTDSSTPVKVKGLANVTQVAAGYFHACALESSGTIWCWGDNAFGELGDGTTTDSNVPVAVQHIQNATSVAAGADDTCAIAVSPGDLWCWGNNDLGQLGVGNTTGQDFPTQVVGLNQGVTQVSMGQDFTCALASIPAPTVECWGNNNDGTLGTGSFKAGQSTVPRPVFGLSASPAGGPGAPAQVTAGSEHACVVLTPSGTVLCWGQGGQGRLGTGDTLPHDIPTPMIGLPTSTGAPDAVTAGFWTGCAVTGSLNAACWGQAVGDGTSLGTTHTSATGVKNLPAGGVSQVTAAYGGCALVRTGGTATELRCWGDNTWGELGDNTTTGRTKPVTVQNLGSNIQFVASGGTHNCAIVHNGGAYCWGDNSDGQLGDGTTTNSSLPVAVKGLPLNLAQLGAADEHTCALLLNGTVRCWGLNSKGQLGNGTTSDSSTPVAVTGLTGVVQIAAGDAFSCALSNAGDVQCWGWNQFGQLGTGTTTDSSTPVQVSGLSSGVVAIAAGDDSACAVLTGGQVQCWGDNSAGQLGNGSVGGQTNTPAPVGGFTSDGPVSLDMGASACALNTGQQGFCWGDNAFGELGDGTSGPSTDSGTPVAIQGL